MDNTYTYSKEETKEKEIKLTVKVSKERFLEVKTKVFNKLKQEVKLPGFRPGKAPAALIETHISDRVYNETLNRLLPEVTSEILEKEKHTPMNQISYELVKMSDAEGVEYKATYISYPEIKLGDFKKIKAKKEEKKVEDKDVEAEITKIVSYYTKAEQDGKEEKTKEKKEELTDEKVKSLGIGFETVAQLKDQVQKELEAISARDQESKWLQGILDEAIKASKITAPEALVAQSVKSREQDYLKKLEDLKLKPEEFLKMQNTTMEKLRAEWATEAKKKFAEELLLLEIIKQQQLVVTDAEIKAEIAKVTDPKLKTELESPEGRRYIVTVLLQQKALEWLRDQVQK